MREFGTLPEDSRCIVRGCAKATRRTPTADELSRVNGASTPTILCRGQDRVDRTPFTFALFVDMTSTNTTHAAQYTCRFQVTLLVRRAHGESPRTSAFQKLPELATHLPTVR